LYDSGKPLKQVEQEYQVYVKTLSTKHSDSTILLQTRFLETIQNLMASDCDACICPLERPSQVGIKLLEVFKVMTAIIYGEYQQALKLGRAFCTQSSIKFHDFATLYMLLGLANISLFKQNGKRDLQMLISARYYLKQIDQICKSTPTYCLGKLALLKAEIFSISPRYHQKAVRQYLIAISFADFRHHLYEGAIANERYARYLLAQGCLDSVKAYMRQSCSLYREWNVYRKADLLQSEIDELELCLTHESRPSDFNRTQLLE
jgi:hypothetical protein